MSVGGTKINHYYYYIDLGQYWPRLWLVAWRHQAVTWNNVDDHHWIPVEFTWGHFHSKYPRSQLSEYVENYTFEITAIALMGKWVKRNKTSAYPHMSIGTSILFLRIIILFIACLMLVLVTRCNTSTVKCQHCHDNGKTLLCRHNGRDGVSNHQPHDCFSTIYPGTDQRKHQSSASLVFVRGIHQWPVKSPHKWPVRRRMFPFDDVIMK